MKYFALGEREFFIREKCSSPILLSSEDIPFYLNPEKILLITVEDTIVNNRWINTFFVTRVLFELNGPL